MGPEFYYRARHYRPSSRVIPPGAISAFDFAIAEARSWLMVASTAVPLGGR